MMQCISGGEIVRNQKKRILSSEKGFTLIELVMVMAVIAILAAVAYPVYTNVRDKAKVTQAKAILNEVRVNAWSEYLETGSFPSSIPSPRDGWTLTIDTSVTDFKVTASKGDTTVSMTLKTDGTVVWEP